MATITTTTYWPHMGAVWARVIELWATRFDASGNTWSFVCDVTASYRDVTITHDVGADELIDHLVDMSTLASRPIQADYLQGLPGWMSTPQVCDSSKNGFVTYENFYSDILALRDSIWTTYTSASYLAAEPTDYVISPASAHVWLGYRFWYDGPMCGCDWVTFTNLTAPSVNKFPTSANPAAMGRSPSVPVIGGGGGGAVDTAGIVTALNDISMIDVDYQVNNGAALFSFRGKVRNE